MVFLDAGTVRKAPDGVDAQVRPGTMRYLSRSAVETLEIVQGAPRTMFFQIK